MGYFAHAADLLLDMHDRAADAKVAFDGIFFFLRGKILENPEFAFDVDRMTDDLDFNPLGIDIIADKNALNQSLKPKFFEVHRFCRCCNQRPVIIQDYYKGLSAGLNGRCGVKPRSANNFRSAAVSGLPVVSSRLP